ncbi:MAG: biotin-dependent carboxyltransferase family protein [Frankiaceae bacterium]
MSAAITVLRPGPSTTVQDLGRPGLARLGVPPAGALDPLAVRIANRLVGNDEGAAVLECVLRGPALRFQRAAAVAVVGPRVPVTVAGAGAPVGAAVELAAGAVLDVGAVEGGLRCWIAVAGGIDVPPMLGSRSTDTLTGRGGRALAEGDRLPLGAARGAPLAGVAVDWPPVLDGEVTVRAVAGPHAEWFAETPASRTWTVTPRSDRTGLRLSGGPLPRRHDREVASHGLVAGAVQVPGDGQPVVLLANHQTTGGYPVPAVVCAADLPLLAQARPGWTVRFTTVDVATARAAWAERLHVLDALPCLAL